MTINMTHEHVESNTIVERYVLQELSPEEVAAFEDHLFSCEMCQKDVVALQVMQDQLVARRSDL